MKQHNTPIEQTLWEACAKADQCLSFADFMRIALYSPYSGYYMQSRSPFHTANTTGDFTTAPLLTPLFGKTLALPIATHLKRMGTQSVSILELGAGSGALATALLPELVTQLQNQGQELEHYAILELSATRRAEQQALLQSQLAPSLYNRIIWWDQLPDSWEGALIANEVLDAIPIHRVCWEINNYWEIGIGSAIPQPMQTTPHSPHQSSPAWVETKRPIDGSRPYDAILLERAQRYIPQQEGYSSELHLEAEALIRTLGTIIQRGVMLWIDYGFDAAQYYHPQRHEGTLRIHEHHTSHGAWWHNIGNVDITAHVNFEAIAGAALETGWTCESYASQAAFLIQEGLGEQLAELSTTLADTLSYAKQAQAVQILISPAEMGELFKVLLLSRGLPNPPSE